MAILVIAAKAPTDTTLPSILVVAYLNHTSSLPDIEIKYVNSDKLGASSARVQYFSNEHALPCEDAAVLVALISASNNDEASRSHASPTPPSSIQKQPVLTTLQAQQWATRAQAFHNTDYHRLRHPLSELDAHLTLRTHISGHALSIADIVVYAAIRSNRFAAAGVPSWTNIQRWLSYLESASPYLVATRASLNTAINRLASTSTEHAPSLASIAALSLRRPIVTRFPPEPSGQLHIGHAKAALLNALLAHSDDERGTLVLRLDDTNPANARPEHERAILSDLATLGVVPDRITRSSAYRPQLAAACARLIRDGNAYADNTPRAAMQAQRASGAASACRTLSAAASQAAFVAMQAGGVEGRQWVIRARIRPDDPNKALRDPVLYRCAAGAAWPTYDLCAPALDALEGVTLALRTTEYADRGAQYAWVQAALGGARVPVWEFARLAFRGTVLSKRHLARLVEAGVVAGWDDARLPTVQGLVRRGLAMEALREFVRAQGPSRNVVAMDWGVLWAGNRRVIDPGAGRHTVVRRAGAVMAGIMGVDVVEVRDAPRHGKNSALGLRKVYCSERILVDQGDAQSLVAGEEITLMNWGNAVVEHIGKDNGGQVGELRLRLHLAGNVKSTGKKITWLSTAQALVPVELHEFGPLLTKDKLGKGDDVLDFFNYDSEKVEAAWADCNVAELRTGDTVQLERYGYYRLDRAVSSGVPGVFFKIPSGKE